MPAKLNGAASTAPGRIRAVDWLRGLSVLFMIECHSLIFWPRRFEYTPRWYWIQNINGLVSAAFLLTAGFAGGLVGSRTATDPARQRRTKQTFLRLAQVLGMSFYFHFACNPIVTQPATLLRVDILLCIAIGVLAVWALSRFAAEGTLALGALLAMSLLILIVTPWAWPYHGGVIATELLNGSTGSMFPICPWLLYPLLGAALGIVAADPKLGRGRLMAAIVATAGRHLPAQSAARRPTFLAAPLHR